MGPRWTSGAAFVLRGGGAFGWIWRRECGGSGDGVARSTIDRGLRDLDAIGPAYRRFGARAADADCSRRPIPRCWKNLRGLLDSTTLGDPCDRCCGYPRAMRSSRSALRDMGHGVSASRIPQLLRTSRLLSSSQPQEPGRRPACRPERSIRIHQRAGRSLPGRRSACDLVDTNEKGAHRPLQERGQRIPSKRLSGQVKFIDFVQTRNLGKVAPYGSLCIGANVGWVNVGIDTTFRIAVNSIRRWRE